jgi:hypothetical protein
MAAWQLPLFFIAGTYQAGLGFATPAFGIHAVNLVCEAVLLGALCRLSGSVWAAVLWRAVGATIGELWQLSPGAEMHRTLWTTAAVLPVLLAPAAFGMAPRPTGQGADDAPVRPVLR